MNVNVDSRFKQMFGKFSHQLNGDHYRGLIKEMVSTD